MIVPPASIVVASQPCSFSILPSARRTAFSPSSPLSPPYRPRIDFHSFRGNVETDLKNSNANFSTAWVDELIGHESTYRRSEGDRYTKKIYRLVNSIRINADLSHLRYTGQRGVAAPQRDAELALFTAPAEKEMRKKNGLD